jgi:hypothetical protein
MIQLVWLTLLAAHIGVAAVWWWLMPGGFPSSSPHFWVNQIAAPLAAMVFGVALLARGKLSETVLPPILATIPLFWMAFGISARLTFPQSFGSLWYLPFFGGALLAWLWSRQFPVRQRPIWLIPTLAVAAAISGWTLPGTQRAPDPSTRPSGGALPPLPSGATDHKLIKLSRDAQLRPGDGRVVVKRDAVVLNVQPMLTLADRSPDRFASSMAPDGLSSATVRKLVGRLHDGARWLLAYKDEDASTLEVTARDGVVQLDALSRLPRPVFSHASSWCELTVQGHKKLTVSFSPAPQQRIEVATASEPPRFAYLDESGTFHVVQAEARQHGPYRDIATGKLGRDQPLTLTLFDSDKPVFTVALADWAQQLSTALSPTAGSGIPVNSIDLQRGGDSDGSPVLITLSLAGTTIGRGTQTVGQASGVYHDRVTVTLP